jgi:hypothetical protein
MNNWNSGNKRKEQEKIPKEVSKDKTKPHKK